MIYRRHSHVELYHITGSPHSKSMLMVYLPKEKMLIEADLYSPPAAPPAAGAPAPVYPSRRISWRTSIASAWQWTLSFPFMDGLCR